MPISIGRDFQDNELRRFSRHCQLFYNSSLVIAGSSSASLDKNYGKAMSISNDREIWQGKIVRETLLYQSRACHPAEFVEEAEEALAR